MKWIEARGIVACVWVGLGLAPSLGCNTTECQVDPAHYEECYQQPAPIGVSEVHLDCTSDQVCKTNCFNNSTCEDLLRSQAADTANNAYVECILQCVAAESP